MAILTSPRFLSPPSPPIPLCSFTPRFHCSLMAQSERHGGEGENGGAAIVWFKQDLRIDDHPGLVAASHHRRILPVYIFDHRILLRFSHEMIELVLLAIEDLRRSLEDQGSNLMIRFGQAEYILKELVKEVRATHVFAEEETEYHLHSLIGLVKETLASDPFLHRKPEVVLWQASFYNIKSLEDLPTVYTDVKKLQFSDVLPLSTPRLPGDMELDWGHLPTIGKLREYIDFHLEERKKQWITIKEISAEDVLMKDHIKLAESSGVAEKFVSTELEGSSRNHNQIQQKKLKNSFFGTSKGNIIAGGIGDVLNALSAYLRYLEGTVRDDWREVHARLRENESRTGASFGALFGSALQLGVISRKRVYYEAIKYEKERNAGFLSPFGYSTATVCAAIDAVCSMEWYWLLALKSQLNKKDNHTRIWRWNGHLIQYTVVGCEGPAVLLVHGFGAFHEHYRDNLTGIADGGNRVWSITLLGFGRSEKPNIVYTELMWAELLRDFIIDVVAEPAHLVGNSMGGYFTAIVAGLWPSLVKSTVLLNTAGNVIPRYSSSLFFKERKISGASWLGARVLLQYLRLGIGSLVRNCYPSVSGPQCHNARHRICSGINKGRRIV